MSEIKEQKSVFEYLGETMKIHLKRLDSFRELGVARSDFYRGIDTLKFMIMRYDPMHTEKITEAIQQIENYPQRLEDIAQAKDMIEWYQRRHRDEIYTKRLEKEMQEKAVVCK